MKIIGALLFLLASLAQAAEFAGVAPLGETGIATARAAAIADALENASLHAGAHIKSSALAGSQTLSEAQSVRGVPPGEYTVIREWQTGLFYHVVLDVQAAKVQPAPTKPVSSPQCAGADYRRKVLMSHFWVMNPAQLHDMPDFPQALQSEISRRLQESGRFLPQLSIRDAAFDLAAGEPQYDAQQVRQLARRFGVQFVLGGVVRDAGVEGEAYLPTANRNLRPGERKRSLDLPFLDFIGLGIKATPAFRRFEMDLFLFDGVSGALINRHRVSGEVEGDVAQQPEWLFKARFYETDFGGLVDQKLQTVLAAVQDDIRCLPFSARIVRTEGRRVFFDAGATSLIRTGDRLQAYRLKPGQPVLGSMIEEVVGSLTVSEVQPLFATAVLDGSRSLEVGDYVRFVGSAP